MQTPEAPVGPVPGPMHHQESPMTIDTFVNASDTLTTPATDIEQIVPSDTSDLGHMTKALNAATAGVVRVTTQQGTITDIFLAAGTVFPLRIRRVWATGTSATGLRGLF
jgi:uncharacterized protein with PhoU and TrkA domain